MWIIKYRAIFFILSLLLIAGAVATISVNGLNWGVDFTGGSILEVEYVSALRPSVELVRVAVESLELGAVSVQPAGEQALILRLRALDESERVALLAALPSDGEVAPVEKRFSAIGPSVGEDLARKGIIAIVIVVVLIVLYLTMVFWGVSRPVASWKYGVVAVIKLIHDLTITTGLFVLIGVIVGGAEINALFLAAFLTVLGLSVNDVIAVFDRIRENLRRQTYLHFDETVGRSLTETMARSLNTSLTVIFVLVCVYLFGGSTTREFALVMALGMIVATYSSVFIASPLLVVWEQWSRSRLGKKAGLV